MKKNKGFTLIELLAVIVILAIIALIAVPVVMNIINRANKSAFKNSAYGLLKAGELFYTDKLLETAGLAEDKTFIFPDDIDGLEFKGSKPSDGTMTVRKDGKVSMAITNGKHCVTKGFEDEDVTISDNLDDCKSKEKYKELLLNGADPVLKTGMIPVTIEANGKVLKADHYTEWYNYRDKVWANAVTVSSTNRQKYEDMKAGEEIPESDILTYFVWIPRYKYKLWYTDNNAITSTGPHSIDIVFENKGTTKSTGTTNGEYLTHPAFNFGEEVNGLWVGKFETSHTTLSASTDDNNLNCTTISCENANGLRILPNVKSLRYNDVSNFYFASRSISKSGNVFGIDLNTTDTHMMKNTEWGAVAYLSHSNYGTCTNGTCTEVYINNNSNYMTGCGGDSAGASSSSSCLNQYGTKTNGIYNQSTTGNISGIFDMSGGTLEYVMGYTTGASTKYGSSGFTEETFSKIDSKYIDIYSSTSNTQYSNTQYSNRILGDATGEIGPFSSYGGSWYYDYAIFPFSSSPWFIRGGRFDLASNAGLFNFGLSAGTDDRINCPSFRVVLQ